MPQEPGHSRRPDVRGTVKKPLRGRFFSFGTELDAEGPARCPPMQAPRRICSEKDPDCLFGTEQGTGGPARCPADAGTGQICSEKKRRLFVRNRTGPGRADTRKGLDRLTEAVRSVSDPVLPYRVRFRTANLRLFSQIVCSEPNRTRRYKGYLKVDFGGLFYDIVLLPNSWRP